VIVDTSALIALVVREDGWEPVVGALERSRRTRISAMTLLELRIVLAAGLKRRDLAEELLRRYRIEPIDFTVEQSAEAARAHQKYGRGHHPAGLNFGECAAYATAKLAGEPLLYVGNDFAQTDVVSALG